MLGIDVSDYQGSIDWAAVAASKTVSFAYAKCTEGVSYVADTYSRNHFYAAQRGLKVGAYHFFRPAANPKVQAVHFVNVAAIKSGDLVPWVDVEVTDGLSADAVIQSLAYFNQAVEARIGKKIVIYSYFSFWNDILNGTDAFSGHPLAIAAYNETPAIPTAPAPVPNGFTSAYMWQFSSKGVVAGINGHVDMDILCAPELQVI